MEDNNCWQSKFQDCDYSSKLLDKIRLLNKETNNKIDITEVRKALYYARKYHGNQVRLSGEPYYSHPIEVACMVADYTAKKVPRFFRTDILVTSLLHDTIEDTRLTAEMIGKIFGELVARQVEDLTRVKSDRKITSSEMVESLWLQNKHDLLLIKLFDRVHNMRTIGAKSQEKAMKIAKETIRTFLLLSAYFEAPIIEDELYQLCENIMVSKLKEVQNKSDLDSQALIFQGAQSARYLT